jgi:hypothetical protein
MNDRTHVPIPAVVSAVPQGSVFLTGQVCSREQRRGRYTKESFAHPGKMLPSIARYLIRTFTQPGEWVCDPMAGIATTIVEAMHLRRHGIGVEYEARWAGLAADNLRLAASQGATGIGQIVQGDARLLPALVPPELHGHIALVITSPPYGPSTHGHARTPGPRRGKVRKINHQYGDGDNLAYRDPDHLADGFTQILTGAATILRPGGIVAVTARPYRRHGELVDIPGMVAAAGINAGLRPHEECVALIAGIRNGRLVPRASFFQQKNVRTAIAAGDPQWLLQHEDVVIFESRRNSTSSAEPTYAQRESVLGQPQTLGRHSTSSRSVVGDARRDHSLDSFTPPRMDRRPQPAPPANAGGFATAPPAHPGRDAERTPDPCLPHPHPMPVSGRPDATDHRRSADHDTPRPPADPSDTAGRR